MFIQQLILFSRNLKAQHDFYKGLGFTLIEHSADSVSFGVGRTVLSFHYKSVCKPNHFAITIPGNRIEDALAWVKKKTKVLPFNGNEIVDFKNWNALSVYFHDADNNIVELIARKNLRYDNFNSFAAHTMIEISEVGVATDNIEATYNALNSIKPLPVFDGSFDRFLAAGDEHGLFIIIDKEHKSWMPVNDKAESSDFVLKGDYNIAFTAGKISERRLT